MPDLIAKLHQIQCPLGLRPDSTGEGTGELTSLPDYVQVSKMRNVTRAKMSNLGVAIWRTI